MNKSHLPIVISAKRTGSTIIQNIVHIICTGEKGLIEKSHDFFEARLDRKVIVPIRDPRDTAISLYRTVLTNQKSIKKIVDINVFKNHNVLGNINKMGKMYNFYKNRANSLILKYEDFHSDTLGDYAKIVDVLCNFLEVENTQELNNKINTILNIDEIKKVSDDLGSFRKYDNHLESGFSIHGNHIESKNVLSWKDRVDESIIDELNELYKIAILDLGYEL
jgi:hypothetical protein